MKLQYQEQAIRAKKDAKPFTAGSRLWQTITFTLDGKEYEGLMSTHWLYFSRDEQWYKLNTKLYEVDIHDLELETRETPQQSLDEKRERRQARRRERRARDKARLEALEE